MKPATSNPALADAVELLRARLEEFGGESLSISEVFERARLEGIPTAAVEDAIWKLVRDGEVEFTPSWGLRRASRVLP